MQSAPWIPQHSRDYIEQLSAGFSQATPQQLEAQLHDLVAGNKTIHDQSINLNPATNVMNPRAEALLASGLGSRPSLGYPGDKYEMGLEAIEKIEIMATALVNEVFGSRYAEIRLASGAMANLYAFMACTQPGDSIIVPPAEIGGHVTHHHQGAAGLYGLDIHFAPVDADGYTVDINGLHQLAKKVRPSLITIGGSLNLFPHPITDIRGIADEHNCLLHFDAAHLCGLIAGKAWQQPLEEGADLMTFSTYKSLGGPPSGVVITNNATLAEKIDAIAFPGLTANFDVAKSAALAMSLLDWKVYGRQYAQEMVSTAIALSQALVERDIALFASEKGATLSHQFALLAQPFSGGQTMAKLLRKANILTCGIGLPAPAVAGDVNGLRLGTPEMVRCGMNASHMPIVADFFRQILCDGVAPESLAAEVSAFRNGFQKLSWIRG